MESLEILAHPLGECNKNNGKKKKSEGRLASLTPFSPKSSMCFFFFFFKKKNQNKVEFEWTLGFQLKKKCPSRPSNAGGLSIKLLVI